MEDERLAKIEQERQNAINSSNNTYNQLIEDNQNLYDNQNKYAEEYEKVTNENLDKQLAFNESKIEQQKEEARKNKETEDKKALNDYTAYVNPYGYQAESMASNGLNNSGVSETAKLGAYNTYQNRLATSNKALQDTITEYDTAMNEARLTNDVTKAQTALSKLQMQLEYQQNYMNNKSTIAQNQLSNNQNLDSEYYNRYQTEYANIQNEKAQAEAIRQWETELAEQQRQYNESLAFQKEQWEKEYALANSSASTSSKSKSSSSSGSNYEQLTNQAYVNPYTNSVNSDAYNGTFSNGYQPDNIGGTKLKKSGQTVSEYFGTTGSVDSRGKNIDNQNVWKIGKKYYVWDGGANQYVEVTSSGIKSNASGGKGARGGGGGGYR